MSAWWRNSNLSKAIEDDLSAAKVTIYDAEFLLATDLQSTSGWLPSMFLKKVTFAASRSSPSKASATSIAER